MSEVLTIGEAMALFAADYPEKLENVKHFTRYLSGAELNVSVGLSRLDHSTIYMTHAGDDPFGKHLYNFLVKEKIDTSCFRYDKNHPTGFQIKEKVLTGDPTVISFRKGTAATHINENDIADINWNGIKHVHLTGIFAALSLDTRKVIYKIIDIAKSRNIRITFDPNIRPALWESKEKMISVINDIASKADIVLPGIKEGLILTGKEEPDCIADFYLERGAECVIIKLGKYGAFIKNKKEKFTVPGFKVERVIDSVGAGDGFAVGVISGLIEGLTLKDSVMRGNAIGALQVMTPGDNDGLPDRNKLNDYMARAVR